MRCVTISSSDERMDCRSLFYEPINPLPTKCPACGFPDLDHVPQPYYIARGRSMSSNELAQAENGNFFLRPRVHHVFELLLPGLCNYFPTIYKGTAEQTPWMLAVPNHRIVTAHVDPSIARCATCGEPRSAHPGTQWTESMLHSSHPGESWWCNLEYDVAKAATWGSSEEGWDKWISRNLFLSIRLLHLLKKIKAKGFYEATCQKPVAPNHEESSWIKENLNVLQSAGIAPYPPGTLSPGDQKWLRDYMKSHARKTLVTWDFKAIERQLGAKLPKSYIDFVSRVGPVTFSNIDANGIVATLLSPEALKAPRHPLDLEDEESRAVHALTFAVTQHGDSFCFDVQKGTKEYAVLQYKHEYRYLEPYADNFATCIQRFVADEEG
jgi:hypothetical protein